MLESQHDDKLSWYVGDKILAGIVKVIYSSKLSKNNIAWHKFSPINFVLNCILSNLQAC